MSRYADQQESCSSGESDASFLAEWSFAKKKAVLELLSGAAGVWGLDRRRGYQHREAPDAVVLSVDHSTVPEGDGCTENDFITLWNRKTKIQLFHRHYLLPAGITGLVGLVGASRFSSGLPGALYS